MKAGLETLNKEKIIIEAISFRRRYFDKCFNAFANFISNFHVNNWKCLSREPDIVDVDNTVLESWAAVREWSILSSSALLSYDGCCRNVDKST